MAASGQYTFPISSQECDFREQVSLPALGDIILQAAGLSADANGFGMQKLNTMNRTWVVSRMAVEMQRLPKWREQIVVETWVEEVGRAATTRHFRVMDGCGNTIGGASTLWAMIDITTRRAVDLQTIDGLNEAASGLPSIIEKPGRLASVENEALKKHTVAYSDIDFNHHANSMKYVEWMLDCFPLEWHQNHQIRRVEINFLREALYGDQVNIHLTDSNNMFEFDIKKTDGSAVCKMKIETTTPLS